MTAQIKGRDGRSKKRPGPEQQKRVIVEAAVGLFGIHGSDRVSIAQICRRADVGRQTFYRCFADKNALIRHIYQFAVDEQVEEAIGLLQQHQPGQDFLPALVDRVIESILARHQYAQFIYADSFDRKSVAFQIIEESMDRAASMIQDWCLASGLQAPSRMYLKAVMSGLTWAVQSAIDSGLDDGVVAEVKTCAQQLLESVMRVAGAAPEGAGG